jgi:hypothetical protein
VAFDLHQGIKEHEPIFPSRIIHEQLVLSEFSVKLLVREKKADKLQKIRFDCAYFPHR